MDKRFMDRIIDWPRMRDNLRLKTNLEHKDNNEIDENDLPEGGFIDKPFIDQVIDHLKFLGYEVEKKQGRGLCVHERRPNFIFGGYYGGIYFKTLIDSNDYAKTNKEGFLSFINQLNRKAIFASIFVDDEWAIIFTVWFPGIYDRKQFGVFMDLWDNDTHDILISSEPETTKFIG
jgi:hypothetical protein